MITVAAMVVARTWVATSGPLADPTGFETVDEHDPDPIIAL